LNGEERIRGLLITRDDLDFETELVAETRAYIGAISRVPQGARANRDNFLDAEILAAIPIEAQNLEATLFAGCADLSGSINSLSEAGNLGEIVQNPEAPGISKFCD
jgi:hypothetical protein